MARKPAGALPARRDAARDFRQVDRRPLEMDLAAGDAADLEEIVYQPCHMRRLAGDQRLRIIDHLRLVAPDAQELGRCRQRGERVSQLVAEHRQEFVLRPVGGAQRRFALADGDARALQRRAELADLVDARLRWRH